MHLVIVGLLGKIIPLPALIKLIDSLAFSKGKGHENDFYSGVKGGEIFDFCVINVLWQYIGEAME